MGHSHSEDPGPNGKATENVKGTFSVFSLLQTLTSSLKNSNLASIHPSSSSLEIVLLAFLSVSISVFSVLIVLGLS